MKNDVLKIRCNIKDRLFSWFVFVFFLIILITFIIMKNITGILGISVLLLIAILLIIVTTNTVVLKDNAIEFKWCTYIKYKMELSNISRIAHHRTGSEHFIEIYNKEGNKSIQLNLKLKYADELLNRIQQYERDHGMNIEMVDM